MTSVDLWVGGVARGGIGAWARADGAPRKLSPEDFVLRIDGRVTKIAGVATSAEEAEPPRVVAFFDAVTSDQASFRWAASRLAERAAELVALGEVEVVVADPEPRVVLAATRDAARLAEGLGGLALFAGSDAAIPLLRDEFLAEEEGSVGAEEAARFLEEETALVLRRQDLLLRHLIDHEPATRAGRVLLYVSQGFDPSPEEFYLEAAAAEGRLAAESRAWVRSLAAHGWTCMPLVYEDRRALLRRGLRIGKWRFHGLGGGKRDGDSRGPFELFGASYEGERDAATASALLELADGELDRGAFAEATESYLRAIHSFYGDPRTRDRQAYAWRQLALALRGAGEIDRARRAMANALELDPSIASAADSDLADLAESTRDVEGLGELASESGGRLLRDAESLVRALDELASRQRLTFALEGVPTGELMTVELSPSSREGALGHTRWTRSGTPLRVASARLRLRLEEIAAEPVEESGARFRMEESETGDADRMILTLDDPIGARASRVMIGVLSGDASERLASLAASANTWHGEIELGEEIVAAAVYVEDLASGDWKVETLELDDASSALGTD